MITQEEIEKLVAGRKLDALTEEHIFGYKTEMRWCTPDFYSDDWLETETLFPEWSTTDWKKEESYGRAEQHPCYRKNNEWHVAPFYSTKLEDAWLVVLQLIVKPMNASFSLHVGDYGHLAEFILRNKPVRQYSCYAGTAPVAICKAALKTRIISEKSNGSS